eukprot:m.136388 g.136388  ORF g.136388 m.136388 type:complete len:172 (+) comp22629_c0_seq1:656-1171(+)
MYWLIVSAGVTFFTRGDPAAKKGGGSPSVALLLSAALWTAAVTATILTTERDSRVHTIARGVLTCTFSLLLVYAFTAGARTAREVDDATTKHSASDTPTSATATRLFALSFWSFIIGVLAWIIDILFCSNLQALTLYPNLHSVWHIGSAYYPPPPSPAHFPMAPDLISYAA